MSAEEDDPQPRSEIGKLIAIQAGNLHGTADQFGCAAYSDLPPFVAARALAKLADLNDELIKLVLTLNDAAITRKAGA